MNLCSIVRSGLINIGRSRAGRQKLDRLRSNPSKFCFLQSQNEIETASIHIPWLVVLKHEVLGLTERPLVNLMLS